MKKGLSFTIAALFVGLGIGLLIQHVRALAADALREMLEEEARISCNCQFVSDPIRVSLLTMSATCSNAALVKDGERKLHFNRLKASFSLGRLKDHVVNMSRLELRDGYARGFGPESATYKFIDDLVAPLPPEKDYPGRWKLKLLKLVVRNTEFSEDLGGAKLVARNSSLDLIRTPEDTFSLKPSIEEVFILSSDGNRRLVSLGSAASSILITDDFLDFKPATLKFKDAFASADFTSFMRPERRIEGKMSIGLDSLSLNVEDLARFRLNGAARVAGTLDRPVIRGSFSNSVDQVLSVGGTSGPSLEFDAFSGEFKAQMEQEQPALNLSDFSASGQGYQLALLNDFKVTPDKIDGRFRFSADELDGEAATLRGLSLDLNISGISSSPRISAHGKLAGVSVAGLFIPDVFLDAELKDGGLTLNASASKGAERTLQFKSRINVEAETPELEKATLEIKGAGSSALASKVSLSGQAEFSGPLNKEKLRGHGDFQILSGSSAQPFVVKAKAELLQGLLLLKATSDDKSLDASLDVPLIEPGKARARLNLKHFPLSSLAPSIECSDFDLNADYSFSLDAPAAGDGELSIRSLQIGCEPYRLATGKAAVLPIRAGSIPLDALELSGIQTRFALRGQLSLIEGWQARASGRINLSTFAGALPRFDDLRGVLDFNASLEGPPEAPQLGGKGSLTDAGLSAESADFNAENINGSFEFSETELLVQRLDGEINQGHFHITGRLSPFDLPRSDLRLSLQDISVQPDPETDMSFSGELQLSPRSAAPTRLSGLLEMQSAEVRRNIDLNTVVQGLLKAGSSIDDFRASLRQLPDFDLDLAITAPRNLFVFTNWLGAELSTDLKIQGTLHNPELSGSMNTLTGWFGLKNSRFELASGSLVFSPGQTLPELDVLAESSLRSQVGDSLLVLLEARGPVNSPLVTLSSDSGLSQKEILRLLTSSGNLPGQSRVEQAGLGIELAEIPLLRDDTTLNINKLLLNLTTIDSLVLEPSYNIKSGAMEPTVVATKRLSDRLLLSGESSFGSYSTESGIKALYQLSPKLSASVLLNDVSTRKNTAFGWDLTWTIWERQNRFLSVSIDGNRSFERSELMRAIRVGENSRIGEQDLTRLQSALLGFYHTRAFLAASADLSCTEKSSQFCRELRVSISEGPVFKSSSALIEGDCPVEVANEIQEFLRPGQAATADLLKDAEARALRHLRAEGYISARVRSSWEQSAEGQAMVPRFQIRAGQPVSFSFEGNTRFSASDFLETINLFKRRQPFGSNTINILVGNIERMYRESGHLLVAVTAERLGDTGQNRINYLLRISEGLPSKGTRVLFEGITEDEVRELAERYMPEHAGSLLSPEHAVSEDIELLSGELRAALKEEGYLKAEISSRIKPANGDGVIEIHYLVNKGELFRVDTVEILGLPAGYQAPELPELPCSYEKVSSYMEALLQSLGDSGYLKAQVTSSAAPDRNVKISIESGAQTIVDEIRIEGSTSATAEFIISTLAISSGDAWKAEALNRGRTALLKSAMFSRVELKPADGELDEPRETLLVNVTERNLRSLELGSGVNSEYGLHLFSEASERGFFNDGRSLTLRLDSYYDRAEAQISQGIASLKYSDPYFLESDYTLTEDLRFQKLETSTNEFDLERTSFASYLYQSWENGLSATFGHTILQEDLSAVSPDAILSQLDSGILYLSFLSGSLTYDQRDNPLNPRKGYNLGLDYQFDYKGIGSNANYYLLAGRASYIAPLPWINRRFSLASSARGSGAWTFADTDMVPISQRLYLGGRSSVRGFRENSLGPRGEQGSILGGDTLLAASTELRYLLADTISLHTFLDAGNVFLRSMDNDLLELRYSTGIGLQYLSPIGPIGLDIGHPLDEKSGEPSIRVHFNVGTNF